MSNAPLNKRYSCPACGAHCIGFWQRWGVGPLSSFVCSNCGARLSVGRTAYLSLVPLVIGVVVIVAGDFDGQLSNTLVFLAAFSISLAVWVSAVPLVAEDSPEV